MAQLPDIAQLKSNLTAPRLEVVGFKLRGEIFGAGTSRY